MSRYGRVLCPSIGVAFVPVWAWPFSQYESVFCPSMGVAFVPVWACLLSQYGRVLCPSMGVAFVRYRLSVFLHLKSFTLVFNSYVRADVEMGCDW